jgi:hypothetical protein
MTKTEVIDILKTRLKDDVNITEEMIMTLVNNTDLDAGIKAIADMYIVSIWDKVSPINGAAANLVLDSTPHNLPNWKGLTYLISSESAVKYLQPNDHTKPGWTPILTEARANELANTQINSLAEEGVIGSLLTTLRGE